MNLPAWVVTDAESIRREAAPYVLMTPEQRLLDLKMACQAAARMLRSRVDVETVLNHVDPIPASTEALLARLRARRAQGRE